jgi:hypothetical protein
MTKKTFLRKIAIALMVAGTIMIITGIIMS